MRQDERGSIVITALLVGIVLSVLGGSLMQGAFADLRQGELSQSTNRALQAAEAGVNDYVAKLTEDHLYYDHWVHRAESTRSPAAGSLKPDGSRQWDGISAWTYPNGRDGGVDLGDDFSYSLQVFPPTAARTSVRILATGWRSGDTDSAKTVEALVRAASIADFQMISNARIVYGCTAVTNGKVYAGNGADVIHRGHANANLYAEGRVWRNPSPTPSPSCLDDALPDVRYGPLAQGYDMVSGTLRAAIPTPIVFANFMTSLGDVHRAALADGIYRASTGIIDSAEWFDFRSDGSIEVRTCTGVDLTGVGQVPKGADGRYPRKTPPPCTFTTMLQVPRNGAVYVDGDAIVSGTVRGRVTVASKSDVVVGDNLFYATPGVDVIGLMAKEGDVMVPAWAPRDLEWWSATLAVEQQWRSPQGFLPTEASHNRIRFVGSTATFDGGGMNQYEFRDYEYDPNLLFLQPPYFPVLEDAYTIELLREVP